MSLSLFLFLFPIILTFIFCEMCDIKNDITVTFAGNVFFICFNIVLWNGYQTDIRQERLVCLLGLVIFLPVFLLSVACNPNIQKSLKNIIMSVAGLFGIYVGFGLACKKNASDVEITVGVVLSFVSGFLFIFFAFDGYIFKKIQLITNKMETKKI